MGLVKVRAQPHSVGCALRRLTIGPTLTAATRAMVLRSCWTEPRSVRSFVRIGADVELQIRGSAPSTLRRDAVSLGAILKSIRVPVTVSGHPRTLAKEIHAF